MKETLKTYLIGIAVIAVVIVVVLVGRGIAYLDDTYPRAMAILFFSAAAVLVPLGIGAAIRWL